VAHHLRAAAERIGNSSDSARLDAEVLLAHVLWQNRAWLYAHADTELARNDISHFQRLVCERSTGAPVAYLTGQQEFWSLELAVDPAVLIPRRDTERLVECALERISSDDCRILELGTGSGAVAIALATEKPDCSIVATDSSSHALTLAKKNTARHHCRNITLIQSDWYSALKPLQQFSLIVSNPPYVRDADPHLEKGDVRAEPRIALTAGCDGLDALRHVIAGAPPFMQPDAWIVLEHGYDQKAPVQQLLDQQGFSAISTQQDTGGNDRVTSARLRADSGRADRV